MNTGTGPDKYRDSQGPIPAASSAQGRKPDGLDTVDADHPMLRQQQLIDLTGWLSIAAALAVVVEGVLGFLLRSWLLLGAGAIVLVGGGLIWTARVKARRGDYRVAANLIVWTVAAAMPLFAFLFQNSAWLFGLTALALTGFLGSTFWARHRWWQALGLGALFGAAVFVVDWIAAGWAPWTRFDFQKYVLLSVFIYSGIGISVLVSLFSLYRIYQQISRISLRLLLTFVFVVVMVAVMVSVTSVIMGLRSARQQTLDQLQSVVTLKARQVDTLVGDLLLDLDALFTQASDIQLVRNAVLDDPLYNPVDARNNLRLRFQRVIERTGRFSELFIIDMNGKIVVSTDPGREKLVVSEEAYFQKGLETPYITPIRYNPEVSNGTSTPIQLFVSLPVKDVYGVVGIVAGKANPGQINNIMAERAGLGETGETYLVDEQFNLLTDLRQADYATRWAATEGVEAVIRHLGSAPETYQGYYGQPVLGQTVWLDDLRAAVTAERSQEEVARGARATVLINVGVALGAVVLAVLISVLFARDVSGPLSSLADTATRIAGGEYTLDARVEREDEIGALATAFNSMTAQLRGLIGSLEERVTQRTRGLETVADVSRAVISELDIERLLPRVVDLVRERFGLYYVGLFIVDEAKEFAILRAGTGDAGRLMLAQGWRLEIGGESMIGQCVATGLPGIRQAEGDRVVRFDNPLLPETHSELALPLRYGQQVIGAMTVQSTRESAFDQTQLSVFQNLADQVAVAVQNARLFADAQAGLVRAQEVQRRYIGQAWQQYVRGLEGSGYERVGQEMHSLGQSMLPEVKNVLENAQRGNLGAMQPNGATLLVPIVQGDRPIGVMGIELPEGRSQWSDDQLALVEALSEQFALAADNQRLLVETQTRAAHDRITSEVAATIRASLDVNSVLQAAVREIRAVLELNDVTIELKHESR